MLVERGSVGRATQAEKERSVRAAHERDAVGIVKIVGCECRIERFEFEPEGAQVLRLANKLHKD